MIKNNILGQMLIGVIVLLLLISSVQMFGWGVGVNSVTVEDGDFTGLPKVPKTVSNAEQISSEDSKKILEELGKRPLFSLERTPFVEPETGETGLPGEGEPGPTTELKVQLTGVVITPEQSYAMILDTTTNQRETYKVGMPLDGEQGGWTLNSIQSRKVTFVSDDEKTVELELEVYSGQLKSGKGNKNKSPNKGSNKNPASRKDKKKNADDIRKKIAERRAQMRAEAAKKNK